MNVNLVAPVADNLVYPQQNTREWTVQPLFFRVSHLGFKMLIGGFQLADIQAPLPFLRITRGMVSSIYKNIHAMRTGQFQRNLSIHNAVSRDFNEVAKFFEGLNHAFQFGIESIRLLDKYTVGHGMIVMCREGGLLGGSIRAIDGVFTKILARGDEAEVMFLMLAAFHGFLRPSASQRQIQTHLRLVKSILDIAAMIFGIMYGIRVRAAIGLMAGFISVANLWLDTRAA